ncbi:MAG: recombinase family protein [Planctomycetaceae bacterium]|nr:recombinase family protein [Planctomycetaceae bacterium]
MLKRVFDPKRPYRVVLYVRMSSDKQNPRSPDQQIAEIKRRLRALGYRWVIVTIYRDDAVSGKYLRKRKGFQKMLRELKTGTVVADLILVDTLERLGRVDELPTIRKELFERHGILVLTADSNFADPNTPQGRALGMVESMRAVEDGRVKAHNVVRGKRDAAELKHWPGGPPPMGYMLKSVMTEVKGREEVDYCLLVPNPATRRIIEILFELAERTSHGSTRLARALNDDPRILAEYKPFQPESVAYWLDSRIYYGDLYWGQNATGVVDDTRVVEPNAPEEVLHVENFCEPLVTRERWNDVHAVRLVRRERALAARRRHAESEGKQLDAPAPGLTLNYLLSGLLFCECGLRMVASSSSPYVAKDGTERRYTSYVCPGYLGGHCENCTRVPEEWVRSVVIGKLCERLFPESA